jgi:hypothetical protein
MTRRLLKAVDEAMQPSGMEKGLAEKAGGE